VVTQERTEEEKIKKTEKNERIEEKKTKECRSRKEGRKVGA
jgi:hypothetical protein